MTEEKGRYRVGSRLVVTCADNSEVENQLSVGSRYEVQEVTRYGSYTYYRLRNDAGDLASYGTHRFDIQPEAYPPKLSRDSAYRNQGGEA